MQLRTHACKCEYENGNIKTENLITIQMPVLSPHLLSNHRELRLAHLALGFISMGYVWQEGQHAPAQVKHNSGMRDGKKKKVF